MLLDAPYVRRSKTADLQGHLRGPGAAAGFLFMSSPAPASASPGRGEVEVVCIMAANSMAKRPGAGTS